MEYWAEEGEEWTEEGLPLEGEGTVKKRQACRKKLREGGRSEGGEESGERGL